MKLRPPLNTELTRRSWLVLAASVLSGCGGAGASSTAGAPGTGGTGIYQGSISGFGSVIINGVTYDNSQAVMRLNDVIVSQDQLRLGMVATVRGAHVTGTTLGTANQVDVWSVAQGVASAVSVGQFEVAGMHILTTSATWFYGSTSGTDVADGDYVSVWGLQADKDGHIWTASCVMVSGASTEAVSSGMLHSEHGQYTLNDLLLSGTAANGLTDGMLVRVQGSWASANHLVLANVKPIDNAVLAQSSGAVEIDGVVTTAPSGTGFMLGSITVEATPASYSPLGASITLGARVEVYGSWVGSVLKATKVELEDASNTGLIEIKSVFQQFTSLSDFVMQGQHCNASGATLSQTTANALAQKGAIFKVKGVKNGDWLNVSEMELDH